MSKGATQNKRRIDLLDLLKGSRAALTAYLHSAEDSLDGRAQHSLPFVACRAKDHSSGFALTYFIKSTTFFSTVEIVEVYG